MKWEVVSVLPLVLGLLMWGVQLTSASLLSEHAGTSHVWLLSTGPLGCDPCPQLPFPRPDWAQCRRAATPVPCAPLGPRPQMHVVGQEMPNSAQRDSVESFPKKFPLRQTGEMLEITGRLSNGKKKNHKIWLTSLSNPVWLLAPVWHSSAYKTCGGENKNKTYKLNI